jgi:hypothetical protein
MSVDEKLLDSQSGSKEDKSAETAGALREAQNNQGEDGQEAEGNDVNSTRMTAKKERAKRLRRKNLREDQEKSLSAGTSKLLQSAWRNIMASWGFSFFYVYVHLFLQNIFGKKLFAPLGSEWADSPGITVKKRDEKGKKYHLPETMGVGCCTIVIIFSIVAVLVIIALLVEVIENPIGTIAKIGWSWLKNNFSEFLGD